MFGGLWVCLTVYSSNRHHARCKYRGLRQGSSIGRSLPIFCTRGPNSAASFSGDWAYSILCWLRHKAHIQIGVRFSLRPTLWHQRCKADPTDTTEYAHVSVGARCVPRSCVSDDMVAEHVMGRALLDSMVARANARLQHCYFEVVVTPHMPTCVQSDRQ